MIIIQVKIEPEIASFSNDILGIALIVLYIDPWPNRQASDARV